MARGLNLNLNLSQHLSLNLNQNGYGIPGLRERAYKDAVQVAGPTSVPRVRTNPFMQDPRMKVSSGLLLVLSLSSSCITGLSNIRFIKNADALFFFNLVFL